MKTLYTLFTILFLSQAIIAQTVGDYTLLVVEGSNTTINGNLDSELSAMGHTVTMTSSASLTDAFDYSPYDAIIFAFDAAEPPGMATILSENEACQLGIISARGSATINTTVGLGTTDFYDSGSFTIEDNGHFITTPFALGVLDLGFTYKTNISGGVAGTTNLGTVAGGNGSLIIHDTYKRAISPWYGHWDGMPWNADAETLMDRIIAWVVAPCCSNSSSSIAEFTCDTSYTVPSGDETYTVSGIYNDTIPNASGCDSIITIDLTITSIDNAVTQSMDTLTSDMESASYQWINCSDSSAISGETDQTFIASENGDYAVIVTSGSCSDTSACFTVSNIDVGLTTNRDSDVLIYPNPGSERIFIEGITSPGTANLIMRDAIGKVVFSDIMSEQKKMIDLSGFAEGNYTLEVITSQGHNTYKVLIKR